jgi:hypothetical protein
MLPLLNRLFSGKISMVALSGGVAAYARGDKPTGRRLLAIASSAAPNDVALHDRASLVASEAGDYRMALDLLSSALQTKPDTIDLELRAAMMQCALGDEPGAAQRCAQAIARSRDDPGPLMPLLSKLRLPGPPALEVLAAIHNWLRPRTYVEIGVETGMSLALATPGTRAIGIDPKPLVSRALPPGTTIYAETSDEFFARHDVRELLGGLPVELAYIDGMHLFEFVLRDFINLERQCTADSTILMDDCYPLERRSAERERKTGFWTGDVWRAVGVLKKYRPDLKIHTIAAAPTGLCVVRGLDPASRVLADNYDAIVKEFLGLDFSVIESDTAAFVNAFPNDWERIKGILR